MVKLKTSVHKQEVHGIFFMNGMEIIILQKFRK